MRRGHRGRRREAARAPVCAPHQRDFVLRALSEDYPLLPGPAQAVQPVVQRGALGKDHPALPALLGIFVARGPHHARDRPRGPGVHPLYFEGVRGLLPGDLGHPRGGGPEDREGEVRRGRGHLYHRAHDAQRRGPAGRHQPLLRRRLCQGLSTSPIPTGRTSCSIPTRPLGAFPPG